MKFKVNSIRKFLLHARARLRSDSIKVWITIFILILSGILLLYFLAIYFDMNASEVSGFFQGIGTIISIFSGYLLLNYELRKRESERYNLLKQNVYCFEKYINHLLFDQIISSNNLELFYQNLSVPWPKQMGYISRVQAVRNILSDQNKKLLEEKYFSALDSLIQLDSMKNLEILDTAHCAILVIYIKGENIKNIRIDKSGITQGQMEEIDDYYQETMLNINLVKKLLATIKL